MIIRIEMNGESKNVNLNESATISDSEIARLKAAGYTDAQIAQYYPMSSRSSVLTEVSTSTIKYDKSQDISDTVNRHTYSYDEDLRYTRDARFQAKLNKLRDDQEEQTAMYTAEWYLSERYYAYLTKSVSDTFYKPISFQSVSTQVSDSINTQPSSDLLTKRDAVQQVYMEEMDRMGDIDFMPLNS